MTATCTATVARKARKQVPADLAHVLPLCMTHHIPEDRHACIAETAYLMAARRGFVPGHELEDWLLAETEVNARLAGEGRPS